VKIRERIYEELEKMSPEELSILYEQVKLIARVRRKSERKKPPRYSIEKIQEMTSSSKGSWAKTVILSREDRV